MSTAWFNVWLLCPDYLTTDVTPCHCRLINIEISWLQGRMRPTDFISIQDGQNIWLLMHFNFRAGSQITRWKIYQSQTLLVRFKRRDCAQFLRHCRPLLALLAIYTGQWTKIIFRSQVILRHCQHLDQDLWTGEEREEWSGPNQGSSPAVLWRYWGKPWKTQASWCPWQG
jgi:hypothetical protein